MFLLMNKIKSTSPRPNRSLTVKVTSGRWPQQSELRLERITVKTVILTETIFPGGIFPVTSQPRPVVSGPPPAGARLISRNPISPGRRPFTTGTIPWNKARITPGYRRHNSDGTGSPSLTTVSLNFPGKINGLLTRVNSFEGGDFFYSSLGMWRVRKPSAKEKQGLHVFD